MQPRVKRNGAAPAAWLRRRLVLLGHLFVYALVLPWLELLRWLPESVAMNIARAIGRGAYLLLARDRKWCEFNLRVAYGENLSPKERRRLSRAVFEHHAVMFCEILRMSREWLADRVVVEGMDEIHRAYAAGHGFLAVSCHLGNWEVMPSWSLMNGVPSVLVVRPLDNPFLDAYFERRRRTYGNLTVPRDSFGPREALRRLRAGEGLSLAIDQNYAEGGVFVPFLGVPAATAKGAGVLALKETAPVFLAVSHRRPDGRHQVFLQQLTELSRTGDFEADVRANLAYFTRVIERHILAHPEQYHWQHGRFRTRPEGKAWTSGDIEKALAEKSTPFAEPPDQYRSSASGPRRRAA